MKKTFILVLAIAAIAACTKSEVQYEAPGEIGFAPVKGNITKATVLDGVLANTQELGVWAFWDKDGAPEEPSTNGDATIAIDYTKYSVNYLVNALFVNPGSGSNWGAPANNSYPWPVNGALVFAGYTTPGDVVLTTDTQVEYVLGTDVMTFKNYANTNEFDLCWFGRTASSYNYRATGEAIPVKLSHALTWITVKVYGEGTPVGNWNITSITLANVVASGTATCNGATKKATWTPATTEATKTIYSGTHTITATHAELTNNVIIPSLPLQLTVNYSFVVQGQTKTDSKTVSLKLNEGNTQAWESGVHYTYTLLFKGNEILVAPSYGDWATSDHGVTVE
jgi:hypothetical protein